MGTTASKQVDGCDQQEHLPLVPRSSLDAAALSKAEAEFVYKAMNRAW